MTALLRLSEREAIVAPLVFDPISALLATREGFRALYLGALAASGALEADLHALIGLRAMLDIEAATPVGART